MEDMDDIEEMEEEAQIDPEVQAAGLQASVIFELASMSLESPP